MTERRKQADFLKSLLACNDLPEHRNLAERLRVAERDERCMKRACGLVIVVTLLALAVLGYLTVLKVPDDASRLAKAAFHFCQALALGSALWLAVLVGFLFWNRALLHRLFAEGRKIITAGIKHQPHQSPAESPTVIVHEGDTAVYRLRTEARSGPGADIITLPKAS